MDLVEQWGSGLQKIIKACVKRELKNPKFEEMSLQFRVTLYSEEIKKITLAGWQKKFIDYLHCVGELSTNDAAKFWDIDVRTARRRLKKLIDEGFIKKVGISRNDSQSKYVACWSLLNPTVPKC